MTSIAVALVLPDPDHPEPGALRLLDKLAGDGRFTLVAVLRAQDGATTPPNLLAAALRAEARLFPRPDRVTSAHWQALRAQVPVLEMTAVRANGIAADVVIDLAHSPAALDLAAALPFGVWRLSAYDPGAGLAEAMRGAPETLVTLRGHMRADGLGRILAQARYDVKFLASRNSAFLREKSVQIVTRELARLSLTGAPADLGPAPLAGTAPGSAALPEYLTRAGGRIAARVGTKLRARAGKRPGKFAIRLCQGTPLDFDPAVGTDIPIEGNRYWADPFLFRNDGRTYLFFEDYDYATRLGHLAVGEIEGTAFRMIGRVGQVDTHLSYPLVFRHGDDILMMPETHQTGRVEIWRATDFPTGWALAATALEGLNPVDSVLFQKDGSWWLATNLCHDSFGDHCSELHLFKVDGPGLNSVVPHQLNPVVIGSDVARGGGRIFEQDGRLFRAAQDNTHGTYGYGLNIMEIRTLDLEHYDETRLRHIIPDFAPGLIGIHHVDACDGLVVADLRWR